MSDVPVSCLAFIHNMGPVGIFAILIIALLLFGKRLPEVARSLGKGIVEFKKGVRGIEDDVDKNVDSQNVQSAETSSKSESSSSNS